MVLRRHLLAVVLAPALALAQRDTTRDALARMEALLTVRAASGDSLSKKELWPVLVVSTEPRYEESKGWYPTQAVAALVRIFGPLNVRVCEACMAPRVYVEQGRVEQLTQALGTPEMRAFDQAARGRADPAKSAVFLDETARGVSLRIINLSDSRVLLAENFDDGTIDSASLRREATLLREQERRTRGDALVHTFFDVGFLPKQHVAIEWTEQWGDTNANLAGISLSVVDPLGGVGVTYSRIIPEVWNLTVGAKLLVSLPTALIQSVDPGTTLDSTFLSPLITGVLVVRLPIFKTNFAALFTLSTNGAVTLGFSLLNISLLPVLP